MATVFRQHPNGDWLAHELHTSSAFEEGGALQLLGNGALAGPAANLQLVSLEHQGRCQFVLLAQDAARTLVNGEPLLAHMRVLSHKDEISIQGERLFFSSESVPQLTTYRMKSGQRRVRCPVCRKPIEDQQTVVRCPGAGCSRLYHQIAASGDQPEKPCWTYNPTCRFCSHPTSLSGELSWTPAKEESDG